MNNSMHLCLTRVVPNIKKLYETFDLENNKLYYEFIEKANMFLTTSYKKKQETSKKRF